MTAESIHHGLTFFPRQRARKDVDNSVLRDGTVEKRGDAMKWPNSFHFIVLNFETYGILVDKDFLHHVCVVRIITCNNGGVLGEVGWGLLLIFKSVFNVIYTHVVFVV